VGTVYCDRELVEVFLLAKVRVKTGGYVAELADVVAWLDFKGWQVERTPRRIDISKELARKLLQDIEKRVK